MFYLQNIVKCVILLKTSSHCIKGDIFMKPRSEMNPEFMWDLSHIFKSRIEWEKAFEEAEKSVEAISAVQGTLKDAQSVRKALDTVYGASEKAELVYIYASLNKSGDNGDPESQTMAARAMNMLVKMSTNLSFLEPELLALPEETLKSIIADPALAKYRHYLDDVARSAPHTLDAAGEKLLARLGDITGVPQEAYDMLTEVDLEFPKVKNENGEDVQLTHGNFGVFRESKSREVRENAFNTFLGTYKKYINTTAATYGGAVKLDTYFSDVRGFDSACHRALFANNVPVSVYDSLIEAVHKSLPSMKKYLDLRKKALGLDKIDMFDLYVPMIDDVEFSMTYEEGKKLVRKALAPLGEEYGKLLDRAFNERWIDVYENKGKTTGAFSCGVFGVHPYVLLNYSGKFDDVSTVAHELGHSMHSYFSDTTQDYANHDYRILVAEVASTVNEVLLTMYMLNTETDRKRRAYILNHFLEGFRTTVYRQTLFAEFERKAHDMYQAGQPLTAESLSNMYKDLVALYYNGAEINDIMSVEWSYIPHFYRGFYVYQYATGFCSAVAIAKHIYKTGDASGYLKFLTLGGSDYPIEELKVAGVDLTKPESVENALKVFDETIDELAALLEEIK